MDADSHFFKLTLARAGSWVGGAVGGLLVGSLALAAPPAKQPGCLIEPSQVAEVGSPVTGVLERVQVELGQKVQAGQPLVELRADVERAHAEVAASRAGVDAEVQAARAALELARQKVRRTRELLGRQFVSQQALDQAEAEAAVAEQKLRLASSQRGIWEREKATALAQLGLRTLRSPIAGIVVERYANPGERVEDRPVLRVANIDPLRVDLMVPAAHWGRLTVGDHLNIRPELPGVAELRAEVRYIDRVLDAASNTFRVRLTLPNPGNRLPAGLRCKAELGQPAEPATRVQPAAGRLPDPSVPAPATPVAPRLKLPLDRRHSLRLQT